MTKLLAQFGDIKNPFSGTGLDVPAYNGSVQGSGLIIILTTLVRTSIIAAGLFTFFNLIMAGYGFLSAGGDAKAVGKAWEKIYMSLIGLLVSAGAVLLAAVFGWLIFGDPTAITSPQIFTPTP